MQIERIINHKRNEAMRLVLDVFMQYEAPDYSEEGIAEFKRTIENEDNTKEWAMYGAYNNEKLVGVIATRNNGNHVALLFVDSRYHRQGFGKALFHEVLKNSTADIITVNSSPYAVEIYQKLGFTATDKEQITNGIRFTPMSYLKCERITI